MRKVLAAAILFAFGVTEPALAETQADVTRTRWLMGTLCTIEATAADTARAAQAIAGAFDEIARLERVMSSWREDSELSRWNAAAGSGPRECSPELLAALDSSRVYAALTAGAFDPTIEPLNRVWDARGAGRLPKPGEIREACNLVDWRMLVVDRVTRRAALEHAGMGVDLGGIGKGLALDRAGERLREAGVTRALLNFGGEILLLGGTREVTIADPRRRLEALLAFDPARAAISTSAQSERGVTVNGHHYGHVFDPGTGRPLETAGSATVIAASATRADALSTALLVLGRSGAAEFAAAHADVGVVWCEPAGTRTRVWAWNVSGLRTRDGAAVDVLP